jgi:hypothetical protein
VAKMRDGAAERQAEYDNQKAIVDAAPSAKLLAQLAAPVLAAMWSREPNPDPYTLINASLILAKKLHEAAVQQTPTMPKPTSLEEGLERVQAATARIMAHGEAMVKGVKK